MQLLPHLRTYPKLVPQEDTKRRTEANQKRKNCRKKSRLLRTTTKNEDQAMDQNNGLETKISKEETKTTLTMDLREFPPLLIRISLQDQTSHMGTAIRTMERHMAYEGLI